MIRTFTQLWEVAALVLGGSAIASLIIEMSAWPLLRYANRLSPLTSLAPYWLTAYLTGILERIVFSIAITYDISGVMIGMVTWNLIKLQAHWGLFTVEGARDVTRTYIGIVGGLLSMFFAVVIGCSARTILSAP